MWRCYRATLLNVIAKSVSDAAIHIWIALAWAKPGRYARNDDEIA